MYKIFTLEVATSEHEDYYYNWWSNVQPDYLYTDCIDNT